jgi:hypothetical protein
MFEELNKLCVLFEKEEYKNIEIPKEIGKAILDLIKAVGDHIIEDVNKEVSMLEEVRELDKAWIKLWERIEIASNSGLDMSSIKRLIKQNRTIH